MTGPRLFLLGLALAIPTLALSQWAWVDANGRKVYSDQPPPMDLPAKNVLRQPTARSSVAEQPVANAQAVASAAAPASAAGAAVAAASAPASAARRDTELEQRRKQLEAVEAQKKKAEIERIDRLKAENCSRARQAKATLDSGIRLARVNDKGEREVLDDAQRAGEAKRLEEIIASDCKAT